MMDFGSKQRILSPR